MARIFVSVPVAADVRAAVSQLRRFDASELRWVAEHQYHITLKFLGDITESQVALVRSALEQAVERAVAQTRHGPVEPTTERTVETWAEGQQPDAAETAGASTQQGGVSDRAHGIRLVARGVGAFPDARRARIVWVGVAGETDRLRQVQRAVEERLVAAGFARDERRFTPHITVARARRPAPLPAELLAYEQHEFGHWRADRIEIVESRLTPTGPRYTVRHHVPVG